MTEASSWTGELLPDLDELMAFDAMRAFLESYWERDLKSDDGLAGLLGSLNRSWESGGPLDPAMWQDWKDAVGKVRQAGGDAAHDPLV